MAIFNCYVSSPEGIGSSHFGSRGFPPPSLHVPCACPSGCRSRGAGAFLTMAAAPVSFQRLGALPRHSRAFLLLLASATLAAPPFTLPRPIVQLPSRRRAAPLPPLGRRARRLLTQRLNTHWAWLDQPRAARPVPFPLLVHWRRHRAHWVPRRPRSARRRRLRRSCGYLGVRVGEASHPGPPRLARPAESVIVPSSSEEEQPGEAAAPVCATCLEPIHAGATGRHGAAYWPACQHPYHTGCLARMRARLAPPVCALCRQPWLPAWDADLSAACNYLGFNPFADSEAEAAPPPPAASSSWTARGPPTHPITSPTNSWAYVSLLHAATGSLAPAATAAWRAHPASATWWEESRVALSNAAPVPLERLVDALLATPGPHGAQYGATSSRVLPAGRTRPLGMDAAPIPRR